MTARCSALARTTSSKSDFAEGGWWALQAVRDGYRREGGSGERCRLFAFRAVEISVKNVARQQLFRHDLRISYLPRALRYAAASRLM
jgi:hypothetical protein